MNVSLRIDGRIQTPMYEIRFNFKLIWKVKYFIDHISTNFSQKIKLGFIGVDIYSKSPVCIQNLPAVGISFITLLASP
jgi:hypothetical protein